MSRELSAVWDPWPMCRRADRAIIGAVADPSHERNSMPRIRIISEPLAGVGAQVILDERIVANDLSSDHFAAALVERIGWALADADDAEPRRRA